ncbi:hypothetical protein B0H14DRAFT_2579982 [Mycena olivaceomarginata]|nr:hypothetical protein B0H14DRAFT_2579982 [Mycena olivaceomarginata]
MVCLPPGIDWGAKDVQFVRKYCVEKNPLAEILWQGKDLMVPDPNVPDWKEPTMNWYPATFIKRHNRAVPHEEYKFRWFECTDGIIYDSESSIVQPSMLRWFTQSRKFCEEIAEVDLNAEQVLTPATGGYPPAQPPALRSELSRENPKKIHRLILCYGQEPTLPEGSKLKPVIRNFP